MEDNRQDVKKRRTLIAVVAVASVAVVLFLCIFSLYHLPERDPVETPEMVTDPNYVESPAGDFEETNDVLSASQEEASQMIGDLEMQYENAKLNGEPYAAEQAGLRLALAYRQAGETQQAITFTNSLIENFGYDTDFVSKCKEFLNTLQSAPTDSVSSPAVAM